MRPTEIIEPLAAHAILATTHPAWFEAALGVRTIEEAATAVGDDEPAELVERSRLVFGPPSVAAREQQLERLLALYGARARPAGPRKPWIRHSGLAVAVATAIAAALVLVLAWPTPPEPRHEADAHGPVAMVDYDLELRRTLRTARRDATELELPRYSLDETLELRLRPRDDVEGSVEVTVLAFDARGVVHRIAITPEVSPGGMIRIVVDVRKAGFGVGTWWLVTSVQHGSGSPDRDVRPIQIVEGGSGPP